MRSIANIFCLAIASACSSNDPTSAEVAAPLTSIAPNAPIGTTARLADEAETSVGVVHMSDGSRRVVIAFNGVQAGPLYSTGWAQLDTLRNVLQLHDSGETGWAWPSIGMTTGTFFYYAADSTVLTFQPPTGSPDLYPGVVLIVTLAWAKFQAGQDIAIVGSNDGGHTFTKATRVSVTDDVGNPSGGFADEPVASVDPTTGDIYVLWRDFPQGESGPAKAYLAHLHANNDGSVNILEPPHDISNALTPNGAFYPPPARGTPINVGQIGGANLAVVPYIPGNDTPALLYIGYPDFAPNTFSDRASCGTGVSPTRQVTTRASWVNIVGGALPPNVKTSDAWFTNTINVDSAWPLCLHPGSGNTDSGGANRTRPEIRFGQPSPSTLPNAMFMAFGRSVRSTQGQNLGARVSLFQFAPGAVTTPAIFYWTPSCHVGGNVYRENAGLPPSEPFCMQGFPGLALTQPALQTAWTWHDFRQPNAAVDQLEGASIVGGWSGGLPITGNTNTESPIASVAQTIPPTSVELTSFGDYESLAVDQVSGVFWSPWADYRNGGNIMLNSTVYPTANVEFTTFQP